MINKILKILIIVALALAVNLFASSLSAQENYTVVVKCPTIANQCGYMQRAGSKTFIATKYTSITNTSTSVGANWLNMALSSNTYGYTYSTNTASGIILAGNSTTFASGNTTKYTSTYRRKMTVSGSSICGFANFNIEALPSNLTMGNAMITYKQYYTGTESYNIWGTSKTPTAANSSIWNNITSTTGTEQGRTSQYYYAISEMGSGNRSKYLLNTNAYTTSIQYTYYPWPIGTYDYRNSSFYPYFRETIRSLQFDNGNWAYGCLFNAYIALENARSAGVTSFAMMFSSTYDYSSTKMSLMSAKVSDMSLLVGYSAPWSCVIIPSVRTNASSACVGDGVISLTASQNNGTAYLPIAAKTWQWYSGTNGSNGTYATIGGTFTANSSHSTTVQAPANTGSVWYKYIQTIKITSNATCTPMGATSKTYTVSCRPASVAIVQCCTPLYGTLNFTGHQTGDRSVTLSWGGITNTNGILHYVISYGTGPTYKQIEVAANRNSIEIGNLTNGRTYHFEIQAIGKTDSPSYCNSNIATVDLSPVCN